MPPALELFSAAVRLRVDAIAFALVALAAGGFCRAYVRRRGAAQELSGITLVTVVMFAVAGALLADGTALVLGYPATATPTTVLLAA